MNNSSHLDLINRYIAAYNRFDIEGMMATLSANVHFENFSGGHLTAETEGAEQFKKLAELGKSYFTEREQKITNITHKENSILVDIAYRAKLRQDIPNGPKAGTLLDFNGESEFYFDNNLICKIIDSAS